MAVGWFGLGLIGVECGVFESRRGGMSKGYCGVVWCVVLSEARRGEVF